MEIKNKTEKVVVTETTTGWICDNCGREVNCESIDPPDGWHQFFHQHHAWGNDSFESLVDYDVCSVKCYIDKIESAIKEDGNNMGFEVDEMTVSFATKLVEVFRSLTT